MSFSSKVLRDLANDVYKTDKQLKKKNPPRDGQTRNEYRVLGDGKKFHGTVDNDKNGFQAMAVTGIHAGKNPKHITISFAGTGDAAKNSSIGIAGKDGLDLKADGEGIGLGHRGNINYLDGKGHNITSESQFESALKFYEKIHKKYPDAVIDVTGHSLGGSLALLVASHYHLSAKVFSAPDPWKVMNFKERYWALCNPDMLTNFRHHGDVLSEGVSKYFTETEGFIGTTIWSSANDKGYSHQLNTFEFGKNGKIKAIGDMDDEFAFASAKIEALKAMTSDMEKSGGNLSHSEKIFLDAAEASAMSDSLSKVAEEGINEIIKKYQKGFDDVNEIWQKTITAAQNIGEHLSYDEVMNALERGGVTHKTVVDDPSTYFEGKISKAKSVKEEYIELSEKIKKQVDQMMENDKELAKVFKQNG